MPAVWDICFRVNRQMAPRVLISSQADWLVFCLKLHWQSVKVYLNKLMSWKGECEEVFSLLDERCVLTTCNVYLKHRMSILLFSVACIQVSDIDSFVITIFFCILPICYNNSILSMWTVNYCHVDAVFVCFVLSHFCDFELARLYLSYKKCLFAWFPWKQTK